MPPNSNHASHHARLSVLQRHITPTTPRHSNHASHHPASRSSNMMTPITPTTLQPCLTSNHASHTLQPCLTSPTPLSPPTSHHSNNTSTLQPPLITPPLRHPTWMTRPFQEKMHACAMNRTPNQDLHVLQVCYYSQILI